MSSQNPSLSKKPSSLTPPVATTAPTHSSVANQGTGFPLYLVIYNNEKMKISPIQMRQIFTKQTYKFVSIKMHLHKWNFRVQFGFQCKELRNQAIEEIRKIKEKYDVGGHVTYSLMEEWEYRNAINFGNQNQPTIANSLPPVPSLVKANTNLPKQKHDKQHTQRQDSQKRLPLPNEDKIEAKDNKIAELTKKTSKGKKQATGEQKIPSQRNITYPELQQKVNVKENLDDKDQQKYHRSISIQQQQIANQNMKIVKQKAAKQRQAQFDKGIGKLEEMMDEGQENIKKNQIKIEQDKQEDLEKSSKQKVQKRNKIVSTNDKQLEKEAQKMGTKSSKEQRKSKQKDKTTEKQASKMSKKQKQKQKQKQTGKQPQAMKQIQMEMKVQKIHEDNAMQVQNYQPMHQNTANHHLVDGTGMQMTINKGMQKYIKDMQIQKIFNDFEMMQKLLRLEIMLIHYMS